MNNKKKLIYETALETLSELFRQDGTTLIAEIRKDSIVLENEYKSTVFFLCKFHGTTFGINRKGEMPPKVKFSADPNYYDIEFNIKDGEGSVLFKEKDNEENFIFLKVV